jgi:YD repeat-containing protein
MFTTLLYSYYGKYPVAKIEGAYINPNIFQLLGFNISSLVGGNVEYYTKWLTNHTQINNSLANIRTSYPNHMVTTYTYKPFFGIYSITDPKGFTMYYDYDGDGNQTSTRDNFSNIISTNNYHFKSN